MKRKQFEPLEIDVFETSVYPFPNHSHTYYEMIYIFKGCGNHYFNKLVIPYKAGDLYLISPEDEHFFDIKNQLSFVSSNSMTVILKPISIFHRIILPPLLRLILCGTLY